MTMSRFTAYRRNLSERGTHTTAQANPDDQPQYEGVVFSDGTVAIKWLTASKSLSYFATLRELLQIHGHPEYGTDIIWHDGPTPTEWEQQLLSHADHERSSLLDQGLEDAQTLVDFDIRGRIARITIVSEKNAFERVVFPVARK